MTGSNDEIARCAEDLFAAREDGVGIAPVRHRLPAKDLIAAYAVQRLNNQRYSDAGHLRVGRKIGLTSEAVQRQLGVDRPDFGVLFDFMDYGMPDRLLSVSRLIAPRIEAEFAFRLARDIDSESLSREELIACVGDVAVAVEIVDSAIAGWDIDIVDTIADNASCGGYLCGAWRPYSESLDLASRAMRLLSDGSEISKGAGAATLGHPLNALAWLADTVLKVGEPLQAGEVVLAGALGPMAALTPGRYTVEIDGFPNLIVEAQP
jgi:2-keto-4-pentenoate hydratase